MPRRGAVQRIRRTREQWTEILRRFEASGLSAREFCQGEGLAVSSLQRWRSRIDRAPEAEFIELVPPSTPVARAPGWALELSLPNGVCLRLRG